MRLQCFLAALIVAQPAIAAPDLAIGDDEVYQRPNSWSDATRVNDRYAFAASRSGISIAWRNADQVEEVEVRVVNLGDQAGSGKISVDVVDADGRILLHLTPPDGEETVQVPAANMGGIQGKIIRMKASWELNGLIDRFDLSRTQYGVMATVEPLQADSNPTNNSKTKTWNNMSRVSPGSITTFNYSFVNTVDQAQTYLIKLERNRLPDGWSLTDSNERRSEVTLQPGEKVTGTLMLRVPDKAQPNGAFSEARIALVDKASGKVFRQHEWFEIFDTTPPTVSNYRAILLQDHRIAIQALVSDEQSGVLEATGVRTEYSTDFGKTWGQLAAAYKTGNFVRPTLFEAVIGPFAPSTKVMLRFAALDTAGNVNAVIPSDAHAFVAPAGAQKLLQMAYIFPRTKPNPIFEVEELKAIAAAVRTAEAKGADVRKFSKADLARLGVQPSRLTEMGVDQARFEDLKADLHQMRLLDLDFEQIKPVALEPVNTAGDKVLSLNAVAVTVP